MAFSYTNGNTVEWWLHADNVVIKMAAAPDNDLAQIWFEDTDGQPIERGQYLLQRIGADEAVLYVGGNYIVDYRKHYVMYGPNGDMLFTLNHHKQQSLFCTTNYIVRRPDGTIHMQHPANFSEQLAQPAEEQNELAAA